MEAAEAFSLVETHAASALLILSLLMDRLCALSVLALETMDGAKEKLELPPPESMDVDDSIICATRGERSSFDGAGEGFGMLEDAAS